MLVLYACTFCMLCTLRSFLFRSSGAEYKLFRFVFMPFCPAQHNVWSLCCWGDTNLFIFFFFLSFCQIFKLLYFALRRGESSNQFRGRSGAGFTDFFTSISTNLISFLCRCFCPSAAGVHSNENENENQIKSNWIFSTVKRFAIHRHTHTRTPRPYAAPRPGYGQEDVRVLKLIVYKLEWISESVAVFLFFFVSFFLCRRRLLLLAISLLSEHQLMRRAVAALLAALPPPTAFSCAAGVD